MCSIVSLSSRHILHILSSSSIQYLFSLSSFPHLNLAILPFFRALSPQIHRNILCHAPFILPVVPRFSDSLPSLLLIFYIFYFFVGYEITTCNAKGRFGPNQQQCAIAYNHTKIKVKVLHEPGLSGVQKWTTPSDGFYT
jgi:hypothetical protein